MLPMRQVAIVLRNKHEGTTDFSLLLLRQTPFVIQVGGVAVAVFGALPEFAGVGALIWPVRQINPVSHPYQCAAGNFVTT